MELQLEKRFEDHMDADEKNFDRLAKILESIADVPALREAVKWLTRGFYLTGVVSTATFLGMLYQLLKK